MYSVNNRPVRALPPAPVTEVKTKVVAPTAEESAEEKRKKLRMQQQLAFQKEASRRISTLPVPPQSKSPVATPTAATAPVNPSSTSSVSPPVAASNTPAVGGGNGASGGSGKVSNIPAKIAAQVGPAIAIGGNDFERDNQARQQRLSKYGAMSVITPVPGFAIKTKRNTGTKVFINICSHEKVPFKTEPTTEIDPDKSLYMIVGTPLEYQNEKDGSYCIIYDVVVHPDEIFVCTINSSGIARHRLCTQALELVTTTYYENVDSSYVILRLASNYKGKDDSGKPAVRNVAIPPPEAFYALNQMAAVALPETSVSPNARPSISKESSGKSFSVPETSSKKASIISSAPSSSVEGVESSGPLSMIRESSISRSTVVDLLEDSGKYGFDTTMKVMVLPRDELENLTAKNFNVVLEAMSQFEQDIKDIIIYPEAGFVILAQQIRPVRRIFINICHHRAVGLKTSFTKNLKEIPRPCPFIIGQVDESYTDSSGKGMVVNIVIPSSVINAVVQDTTGDLRDQVSVIRFDSFLLV